MKQILLLTALAICAVCRGQNPQADALTDSLLAQKQWFTLDWILANNAAEISPLTCKRAKAFTDARFRRYNSSNAAIGELFADPATPPEWQEELVYQMISNLRLAQEFGTLAQFYGSLLEQNGTDPQTDNGYRFYSTLAKLPPTRLERPDKDVEVGFTADSTGRGQLIYSEVEIGGMTERFIVDTGCAEFSLASAEFAEKHGIRPVSDMKISLGGVAGNEEAWLGIADLLKVGEMTLHNAIFVVCPKERLMPEGSPVEVDAVLGCNFLLRSGVVEFLGREHKLRFPLRDNSIRPHPNVIMENNGLCYAQAAVDGNPIVMVLDSGNVKSDFSTVYLNKYGRQIAAAATEGETKRGGVGGILEGKAYTIPAVSIQIGDMATTLYNIETIDFTNSYEMGEDGSLGVDFFLSSECVTLDFDNMSLSIKGKTVNGFGSDTMPQVDIKATGYTPENTMLWQSKNRKIGIEAGIGSMIR